MEKINVHAVAFLLEETTGETLHLLATPADADEGAKVQIYSENLMRLRDFMSESNWTSNFSPPSFWDDLKAAIFGASDEVWGCLWLTEMTTLSGE